MMKNRINPSASRVCGVVPPLVTPLTQTGDVDVDSLARLIDFVIDGGVNGLFMLGTTGEFCGLSMPARELVVEAAVRAAAGRVPVYVQITDACFDHTLAVARCAERAGVDAVIISTPFYYHLRQSDLVRYVRKVLAEQSLPVILYNIPQMTGTEYEPGTVRELIASEPRLIAMKDSSGDLDYHRRLIEASRVRDDFSVLIGNEFILGEAVEMGSVGVVGGGGIYHPQLMVAALRAALERDGVRLAACKQRLESLGRVFRFSHPMVCIAALKRVLRERGLIDCDAITAPFGPLDDDQLAVALSVAAELDEPMPIDLSSTPVVRSRSATSV